MLHRETEGVGGASFGRGNGLKHLKERRAGVPGHRRGWMDDVIAGERADGGEVKVRRTEISELVEEGGEVCTDGVESMLVVTDEIHLVDRYQNVANAEKRGNAGMSAGLDQYTFACVDENDGERGGTGAGGHVAGVLLVARGGGGDALFAFGAKAVGEKGEIKHTCAGCSFAFDGM